MVTISIQPYTPKKIGLVALSILCLSCLSCFGEPLYVNVNSTPYDKQMARIRATLSSKPATARKNLSLSLVNHWIGGLRAIPYGFSMQWKTLEEVQTAASADCKGKAVALYQIMHSRGAENLRLVIGRRLLTSRKTHAWLEWTTAGGTYVLDPTINSTASRADRAGRSSYIPLYAYAGAQKYRAAAPMLYVRNQFFTGQRVASGL